MRKFICLLTAVLVCVSLALPVFAAKDDFVPSIEYKDGPVITGGVLDGTDVTDCLIVTTIEQARNDSTDISEEERQLLLDLYDKLLKDELDLPLDYDYTILELLDISFKYEGCVNKDDHIDKEQILNEAGKTVVIDFDLDVPDGSNLKVLVYNDGAWEIVKDVVVNNDGTVTVTFERIGPVAFVVDGDYQEPPAQTGDQVGSNLVLWISLLCLSAVALIAVVVLAKRKAR